MHSKRVVKNTCLIGFHQFQGEQVLRRTDASSVRLLFQRIVRETNGSLKIVKVNIKTLPQPTEWASARKHFSNHTLDGSSALWGIGSRNAD